MAPVAIARCGSSELYTPRALEYKRTGSARSGERRGSKSGAVARDADPPVQEVDVGTVREAPPSTLGQLTLSQLRAKLSTPAQPSESQQPSHETSRSEQLRPASRKKARPRDVSMEELRPKPSEEVKPKPEPPLAQVKLHDEQRKQSPAPQQRPAMLRRTPAKTLKPVSQSQAVQSQKSQRELQQTPKRGRPRTKGAEVEKSESAAAKESNAAAKDGLASDVAEACATAPVRTWRAKELKSAAKMKKRSRSEPAASFQEASTETSVASAENEPLGKVSADPSTVKDGSDSRRALAQKDESSLASRISAGLNGLQCGTCAPSSAQPASGPNTSMQGCIEATSTLLVSPPVPAQDTIASAAVVSSSGKGKGKNIPVCPPLKGKGKGKSKSSSPSRHASDNLAHHHFPCTLCAGKCFCAKQSEEKPDSKQNDENKPLLNDSAADDAARERSLSASQAPFGKRLHWVKPVYDRLEHDTVFSSSKDGDVEFDPESLAAHLRKGSPSPCDARPRRQNSFPRRESGISVLSSVRAQQVAIALSKLRITADELCARLWTLDFEKPDVCAEDIELLIGKLPTADEATAVLKHVETPGQLRDIERKLLPLCKLSGADARLRLAYVLLTHSAQYSCLLSHLECMQIASKEVLESVRLHQLLRMILKIANYINHGSSDGAKAFSVKSLAAFTTFKVGTASALQYLCRALCDVDFVKGLEADLVHVFKAARINTVSLNQELAAFRNASLIVEGQLAKISSAAAAGDDSQVAVERRTAALLESLRKEAEALQSAFDTAAASGQEAQRYLGEPSRPLLPNEDFFSCLASFISLLGPVAATV